MSSKARVFGVLLWCAIAVAVPYLVLAIFFGDRKTDDRLAIFYDRAAQIEALSLGSSHTRALHFPSMGLDGYSFADDGGDIEMAAYKLSRILPHVPNLKYVMVTVGPGFLSYNRITGVPGEFPSDYISYTPSGGFAFTGLRDLYWEARSALLQIRTDAIEANKLSRAAVAEAIRGPEGGSGELECSFPDNPADHPHEDGIEDGFARTPIPSICMTEEFERADAMRRVRMISRSIERNPEIVAENIAYLKEMSDLAKAQGAELVLVLSPTSPDYFNTPELQAMWADEEPAMQAFAQAEGVRIVDLHDLLFETAYREENIWFSDPNHLSFEGAKQFSEAVGAELGTR